MSEKKSPFDTFFDIADAALSPLESALSREPTKPQEHPIIDAEFDDVDETGKRQKEWEKSFDVIQWATVSGKDAEYTWHAFPEGSMKPLCQDKDVETTHNRQVLTHGKTIAACTSCIIAVSK